MAWRIVSRHLFGAAAAGALVAATAPAEACGGFFCSQAQPVNQAAERIIFSHNGDGTVTAVIQILYEGPAESFSWLLPISSVPEGDDIAVASDVAFARLQAATNPSYNLTTRVEGQCRADSAPPGAVPGFANGSSPPAAEEPLAADGSGVTVAASGIVGAFEWTALELDPALEEPADAAIEWLTENGYDVTPGSEALLGPYLADGMYLLALRLTKGSSVGSIRPIVLTYDAELPMIPIKLTAVAANENMGVMTWLLSDARAVPMNYNALELNEARINWFNASANYNDVVTAAADDAGGQGFVTEFADSTGQLAGVVWPEFEEQTWQDVRSATYGSFDEIFNNVYAYYQGYDGFWDAMRAAITLPADLPFEDFQACPYCYTGVVQFSPTALFESLEDNVIEPIRSVQELLDRRPYVTRLYSTLSAAEMTLDPVFTMNPDLSAVSNLHTAERIIECNSSVYEWEASWRIELPQGSVLRGTPEDVGSWPAAADNQPPNLRVLRLSSSGAGEELTNNKSIIDSQLADYNEQVMSGVPMVDRDLPGGQEGGLPGSDILGDDVRGSSDGGCALGQSRSPGVTGWGAASLLLALAGLRRRPRRA